MFKKSKRIYRARKASHSESDEETNSSIIPPISLKKSSKVVLKPTSSNGSKANGHGKADKAQALSFKDEEDDCEGTFKVKKSTTSKRIASKFRSEHKKDSESFKIDIKENSPERGISSSDKFNLNYPNSPKVTDENIIKDHDEYYSEDDDGKPTEGSSPGHVGSHQFRHILKYGEIPDANMIHIARKRRQMARETGAQDYIPLEEEKSGPRLIREDEDFSDDEERINFKGVSNREKEIRIIQDTILAAQEGSNSEDSEQDDEWEKQQIRKGVNIPQVHSMEDRKLQQTKLYSEYEQMVYNQSANIFNPQGPSADFSSVSVLIPDLKFTKISESAPTFESVKKYLQKRLDDMVSVYRTHCLEKDDITSRAASSKEAIDKCESAKPALETQSRFFQEMRGYARDLVDCLNEKLPQINLLQRQLNQLLKQKADKLVTRRQQDIKDQSQEYSTKAVATPNLINATSKEDNQRNLRRAEREGRRSRRRRKRENLNIKDHHDGMSTDEEETQSEMTVFNKEKVRIVDDSKLILSDVVEDFYDFKCIRAHFERWKFVQSDSYNEAYISLCIPKLLAPLVQFQLLAWNPLQENSRSFEKTHWFSSLVGFGMKTYEEPSVSDPDIKLIPSLIEKVLVPKLSGLVENVWDPMSSRQTNRLVTQLNLLIDEYPTFSPDSKNSQSLINAVKKRLQCSLDEDVFIPLLGKDMLENKASGASLFYQRQFWSCVKLMSNILMFHGIISDSKLKEMALNSLLNRYIIIALANSPITKETYLKCIAIIDCFPKSWFKDLKTDSTLPQLESLCRFLLLSLKAKSSLTEKDQIDRTKIVIKILVAIHSMDHAMSISV